MKKNLILLISVLAVATGALIFHFTSKNNPTGVEVEWKLLGEMDYITGKGSSEVHALHSKRVKIPGFMVPLEDNMKSVSEFLLVPSPQACIHVPPPPPNQMVYVRMESGSKTEVPYGPIWVYGKLNLVTQKSKYGEASFELIGDFVEPYK